MHKQHSRRTFLALAGAAAATLATPALATTTPRIGLHCLHTGSTCSIAFDGSLSSYDLMLFKHVTRDWRKDVIGDMDLRLLYILKGILETAQTETPFGLISGYRTPETNHALSGTARYSKHVDAQALDLRHAELSTRELYDIAWSMKAGGVGYYPQSRNRFVHVDTGRVRTW